jgi:hypothetical protein
MAAPTVRDLGVSVVRTFVTLGVGWAVAALAKNANIVIDEQTSSGLVQAFTVTVTAIYYFIVRSLEIKVPGFGWLLGLAKLPNYASPTGTVPEVPSDSVPTQ